MFLHKKKIEPAIFVPLRNKAGRKIKLKLSIDLLQKQLKATRESGQEYLKMVYGEFEATYSVAQVEEVVFNFAMEKIKSKIEIPKSLGALLCFEYDRYNLIYNDPIQGREMEFKKLRSFLTSKRKTNCIMIGNTGTGRTTIVKDFVRHLLYEETDERLRNCVVLRVNLGEIPEGKKEKARLYKKLRKFIKENGDNIILHFDSFEDLSNYSEMEDIFYDSVAYWNVKLIGEITTQSILTNYFSPNTYSFINLIPVEEFELEEIEELIKPHVKRMELNSGISIPEKMVRFAIMTGSYMATTVIVNPQLTLEILNFAVINAKINGTKHVAKPNILAFYNMNQKLMDKTEKHDRLIVAYHEIGHYIIALKSELIRCSKNAYVSALPIGDSLGTTVTYEIIGKKLMRDREYYIQQIAMCYGGRVSEKCFTNTISTAASADIEEASGIAEAVVLSGGLANNDELSFKSYMWGGNVKTYLLTDHEKEKLNKEIAELLKAGFDRANEICQKNADLIKWLVFNLLNDGILLGSELDELVAQFEANPEGCKALIPE